MGVAAFSASSRRRIGPSRSAAPSGSLGRTSGTVKGLGSAVSGGAFPAPRGAAASSGGIEARGTSRGCDWFGLRSAADEGDGIGEFDAGFGAAGGVDGDAEEAMGASVAAGAEGRTADAAGGAGGATTAG